VSPQAPSRKGQAAKERAIAEAATRVFLRHGYTDASVDAIAAEAGVAKQTVYNHFGGKDQLFRSVISQAQQSIGGNSDPAALEEWLATSRDLGADLRTFGREAVRAVLREDIVALRRLVIAERDRHPELLAEWARPRPAIEQALARAISRQAQGGTLDVPDVDLAARQLLGVIFNEATVRSLFGRRLLTDQEIAGIVDSGLDMWLRCYRYRGPAPRSRPEAT
jgi:TetR/AcrR family transcriptional repressor of mexJK operon